MSNVHAFAADRAAAAVDRAIRHGYTSKYVCRGYQAAHAMVDALIKSQNNGWMEKRIAANVQKMR